MSLQKMFKNTILVLLIFTYQLCLGKIQFENIIVKKDTIFFNYYPDSNGLKFYAEFDNYPSESKIALYQSENTKPDSILILPSGLVFVENFFTTDSVLESTDLYQFYNSCQLRQRRNYYLSKGQHLKELSYSFDGEMAEFKTTYYLSGAIESKQIFNIDKFGRPRNRNYYGYFSDDTFLNDITLESPTFGVLAIAKGVVSETYFSNGKIKKKILWDSISKNLSISYFQESGFLHSTATLKYGELSKAQILEYFNQSPCFLNSIMVPTIMDSSNKCWYYHGPFILYDAKGEIKEQMHYEYGVMK